MTLEQRFCRLEKRLAALEQRFAALEECMERMLSLLVRIAECQGVRE
jgi:hypothetical protein